MVVRLQPFFNVLESIFVIFSMHNTIFQFLKPIYIEMAFYAIQDNYCTESTI